MSTLHDPSRLQARSANWAVGLAAAVLLMVSLGGYFYHREQLRELAAEHVRLQVTGPASLQAGVPTVYTVSTTAITGDPMPAEVQFALFTPDETRLLGHTEMTDEQGRLRVTIPADMDLPETVVLKVVAKHDGKQQRIETRLSVEPVRYIAQLSLDKPLYRPGETIYYRSLALSRFGLAANRELPVHFEILDPSGAAVPDSQLEGITQRGVGSGAFKIPDELAGGQYVLVARSPDEAFSEEKRSFFVRLPEEIERSTQETTAKTIPINPGKVEVSFYPESGELVGGLENRVYFVARDPLGEPVHIKGTVVDGSGNDITSAETIHKGMGTFSFTPRAQRRYHLKITSPADVTGQPKLPKVSAEQKVVFSTGTGVFDADAPLEFNLRAAEADMPVVVSATCRGVSVGQQALVTKVEDNGANPVVIPLAEEVGGVIRLTVYDYSVNPPKPTAERLVYRRMGRKLSVRAAEHHEHYSPGETVSISLVVTDEKARPVPAALGVAVVDDALLSLADDDTPSMPTHFLLGTEVENPEDLEDADFYLSDDPEAAVALDLLLGTQGRRRFVGNPPAMFDNLGELRAKYETSLAEYRADRTKVLSTLTTVSFFAGLGLVLLVAMLGLLKVVSGVQLWVPAVGVTTCCLVIGMILMDPDRLKSGGDAAVPFLPFHMAPPEVTEAAGPYKELHEEQKLPKTETSFWHPMLLAGEDGKAHISFDLPDSISTFRIRVDAHGAGRIGSGSCKVISRTLTPK